MFVCTFDMVKDWMMLVLEYTSHMLGLNRCDVPGFNPSTARTVKLNNTPSAVLVNAMFETCLSTAL